MTASLSDPEAVRTHFRFARLPPLHARDASTTARVVARSATTGTRKWPLSVGSATWRLRAPLLGDWRLDGDAGRVATIATRDGVYDGTFDTPTYTVRAPLAGADATLLIVLASYTMLILRYMDPWTAPAPAGPGG